MLALAVCVCNWLEPIPFFVLKPVAPFLAALVLHLAQALEVVAEDVISVWKADAGARPEARNVASPAVAKAWTASFLEVVADVVVPADKKVRMRLNGIIGATLDEGVVDDCQPLAKPLAPEAAGSRD